MIGSRPLTLINIVRADIYGHNAIVFHIKHDAQVALDLYRINRFPVVR